MDHNDFDFDGDLIDPLIEFFKQIGIRLNKSSSSYRQIKFPEDCYFPTASIVDYEKKLIKSSIIWDIVEDRKK